MRFYPLLAGVGAAAAGAAVGAVLFTPRADPPVGPVARFSTAIDLGERRPGEVAVADFPLANTGDQPLVVSEISATCSCAGLEAEQDGRRVRVTEVTVPPGASAPLFFQVSVAADPGRSQTVHIRFRTNDPAVPAADVPAVVSRVVGVPFARPMAVSFGAVRVGMPAAEVVDVLPNATAGLRVLRATSSRPDLVSAALEPPETGSDEPGGKPIARVRVTALAAAPADLDAVVAVGVAGDGLSPQAEVLLRVSGRVRHPVECRPSEAMFRSTDSQTVYLVGADAGGFTADVTATPAGLSATVAPEPPLGGRSQARLVLIRTAGSRPSGAVRLTVKAGDAPPFELEVPVSCPAP